MKILKLLTIILTLASVFPASAAEPRRLSGDELKEWFKSDYTLAGYSITFGGNTFLTNRYKNGSGRIDWRGGPEQGGTWVSDSSSIENDMFCTSYNGGPKRCSYIYEIRENMYFTTNEEGKSGAVYYKLPPYEEMARLAIAPASAIKIKQVSPEKHLEKLKDNMRAVRPDGDGPFPVVVQAPGCSGFFRGRGMYDPAQKKLVEMGYAVVRADYFKARNEPVCDGGAVTATEAASDVKLMVEHLKTLSYVDADNITIMGWSFGGGAALLAANELGDGAVKRTVVYYPSCNRVKSWKSSMPLLILMGEADTITPVDACKPLIDGDQTAKLITYPNAYHAFDNINLPPKREYRNGGLLGHNPEATEAAWAEVVKFLAQ